MMAKFEEKLKELQASAAKKKNVLEQKEIDEAFAEMELDEECQDRIEEYFDAVGIEVLYKYLDLLYNTDIDVKGRNI